MSRVRRYGNAIDGIVLLDKPLGISSNRALQQTKKAFSANKAGHTGSLDPLATGLLPICFGEATKFSHFLLDANKTYQVAIKLGIVTTTGDAEGDIISEKEVVNLDEHSLEQALSQFRGTITQVPPMYSALKHQGQPLYKLARQGIVVTRKQRTITINNLQLLSYSQDTNIFNIEVSCTKGTYMRTLAMDIGDCLGCGASVVELRRLAIGPYHIDKDKLNALLATTTILVGIPSITLTEPEAIDLKHGKIINCDLSYDLGIVQVFVANNFLGMGEIVEKGTLKVKRLLATNSSA